MADINTTIPLINSMVSTVQHMVNFVQVLVGGLFGLYIILVILKWKESRDLKKIMKQLHRDIVQLNTGLGSLNCIYMEKATEENTKEEKRTGKAKLKKQLKMQSVKK